MRCKLCHQSSPLPGIGSAVHPSNTWLTGARSPLDSGWIIAVQLPVQVTRGIFVVGENQYLLPLELSCLKSFEFFYLGIFIRINHCDDMPTFPHAIPYFTPHYH